MSWRGSQLKIFSRPGEKNEDIDYQGNLVLKRDIWREVRQIFHMQPKKAK